MKAILISRVSTEEQKEAGLSLQAQEERLKQYCKTKGFDVIQVCSFDESAYSSNRTSFDAIIDVILAQTEKIAVCCDKVDRLTRNAFDKRISVLYEKALKDEIELHFVSDGQTITSRISAVEKFQFSINLGLAKYYSDAISDNVKRAMEQKLRKGEWLAKAPYGYKNITLPGDIKDVVVDQHAAHIVKQAFELYATGAFSLLLLCNKMKKDFDVDWGVSYIDKVFNNHFYYGIMMVKGNSYPHRYPPIITKELFDAVQAIKKSFNKKRSRFGGKQEYLYRGLLRCAQCGLAITPEKHKGHVYYHCTQYNGKHNAKWFREEAITEQIGIAFKRMQLPREIVDQVIDTLSENHANKVEFHKKQFSLLTKKHQEITDMLDNLYLDKLKGRITESQYDKFYHSLREQVTDVALKLEQLQAADDTYHITAKYLLELASRAFDLFISSEVEEKRQLIKLVLSNLKVDHENIVYDVQKPFDLILNCSEDQAWRPQRDSNPCFRRERAMS
jgi:site-specific DNA recombinase